MVSGENWVFCVCRSASPVGPLTGILCINASRTKFCWVSSMFFSLSSLFGVKSSFHLLAIFIMSHI